MHIYGGYVFSNGPDYNYAIGGSRGEDKGTIEFAPGMKVKAGYISNDGKYVVERVFTSGEREAACQWRRFCKVDTCFHTTPTEGSDLTPARTYIIDDNSYHTMRCRYCDTTLKEKHDFVDGLCVCGMSGQNEPDTWTISVCTTDNGMIYGEARTEKVVRGQSYTLPVPATVSGTPIHANSKKPKPGSPAFSNALEATIFVGVPIIVIIPPKPQPKANGMSCRCGEILDAVQIPSTTGSREAVVPVFDNTEDMSAPAAILPTIRLFSPRPAARTIVSPIFCASPV